MAANIREVRGILTKLQENFQCVICLDLLSEPVSTACNHQFCRGCISRIAARRKAKCPLCKQSLSKRGLNPNEHLSNIVEGVRQLVEAATEDTSSICTPPLRLSSQRISNTPAMEQFRRMYPTPVKSVKRKQVDRTTSADSTAGSEDEDETALRSTGSAGRQPVAQRYQRRMSSSTGPPPIGQMRPRSGPLPLARANRAVSKSADIGHRSSRKRPATVSSGGNRVRNENEDPLDFPVTDDDGTVSRTVPKRTRSLARQGSRSASPKPTNGDAAAQPRPLQPVALNTSVSSHLLSAEKRPKGQPPSPCEHCGKVVSSRGWARHLAACPVLLAIQASALDCDDTPSSNTRRTARTSSVPGESATPVPSPDSSQHGPASHGSTPTLGQSPLLGTSSSAQPCADAPQHSHVSLDGGSESATMAVRRPKTSTGNDCASSSVVDDVADRRPPVDDVADRRPPVDDVADRSPPVDNVESTVMSNPAGGGGSHKLLSPLATGQSSRTMRLARSPLSGSGTTPRKQMTSSVFFSQPAPAVGTCAGPMAATSDNEVMSPPGILSRSHCSSTPSPNSSGVRRALRHAMVSSGSSVATSQPSQTTPRLRRRSAKSPSSQVDAKDPVPALPSPPPPPVAGACAEGQSGASGGPLGSAVCRICGGTAGDDCVDCFSCTQGTYVPPITCRIFQSSQSPPGHVASVPPGRLGRPGPGACVQSPHSVREDQPANTSLGHAESEKEAEQSAPEPTLTCGTDGDAALEAVPVTAAVEASNTQQDADGTGLSPSLLERACSIDGGQPSPAAGEGPMASATVAASLPQANASEIKISGPSQPEESVVECAPLTETAPGQVESMPPQSSPSTSQPLATASGLQQEVRELSEIYLLAGSAQPASVPRGTGTDDKAGLDSTPVASSAGGVSGGGSATTLAPPSLSSQPKQPSQQEDVCASGDFEQQNAAEVLAASGGSVCNSGGGNGKSDSGAEDPAKHDSVQATSVGSASPAVSATAQCADIGGPPGGADCRVRSGDAATLTTDTCTEMYDNIIEGTEAVDDVVGMDDLPLQELADPPPSPNPVEDEDVILRPADGTGGITPGKSADKCLSSENFSGQEMSGPVVDDCTCTEVTVGAESSTEDMTDSEDDSTEDDVIPPTPPMGIPLDDVVAGDGDGEEAECGASTLVPAVTHCAANPRGRALLARMANVVPSATDSICTQDVSCMQKELASMKGELDFLNAFIGSETSGTDSTLQTVGLSTDGSSSLTDDSVRLRRPSRTSSKLGIANRQQELGHGAGEKTCGAAGSQGQDGGLSLSCLQQAVDPSPVTRGNALIASCNPDSEHNLSASCLEQATLATPVPICSGARDAHDLSASCLEQAALSTPVPACSGTRDAHNLSASCLEEAALSTPLAREQPSRCDHDLSASCLEQAAELTPVASVQPQTGGRVSVPSSQATQGPAEFSNSCLEQCLKASNGPSRNATRSSGVQAMPSSMRAVLSWPGGVAVSDAAAVDTDAKDVLVADSQPVRPDAVKRKSPPDSEESDDDDDEVIGVRKKCRFSLRAAIIDEDEDEDEEAEMEQGDDIPLSATLNIAPPDDSDDELDSLPSVFCTATPAKNLSVSKAAGSSPAPLEDAVAKSAPTLSSTPPDELVQRPDSGRTTGRPAVELSGSRPGDSSRSSQSSNMSVPAAVAASLEQVTPSFEPTPPPPELGEFPAHLLRRSPASGCKEAGGSRKGPSATAGATVVTETPSLDSIEASLPSVLPKWRNKAIAGESYNPVGTATSRASSGRKSMPATLTSPTRVSSRSPTSRSSQNMYQLLNIKRRPSSMGAGMSSASGSSTNRSEGRSAPGVAVDSSETQDTSCRQPAANARVRIAATPPCPVTTVATRAPTTASVPVQPVARPAKNAAPSSTPSAADRQLCPPPPPEAMVTRPSSSSSVTSHGGDFDLGLTASGRLAESAFAGPEISIVLSTPPASLVSRIQVLKKRHGIRLAHTLSRASTHVVFNSDHTRVVQQSVKYFQALAARTWMVTVSWLEECYASGKIVNEELHEVIGDRQGFMGAPRKARFARRFDEPSLFHEFAVYLSGQFYVIGKDILAQILQIGGAVILESPTSPCPKERTLVALFDPDAGEPDVPSDFGYVTILSAQWALDSLASYKLLPMADFAPCIDAQVGDTDVLANIYDS